MPRTLRAFEPFAQGQRVLARQPILPLAAANGQTPAVGMPVSGAVNRVYLLPGYVLHPAASSALGAAGGVAVVGARKTMARITPPCARQLGDDSGVQAPPPTRCPKARRNTRPARERQQSPDLCLVTAQRVVVFVSTPWFRRRTLITAPHDPGGLQGKRATPLQAGHRDAPRLIGLSPDPRSIPPAGSRPSPTSGAWPFPHRPTATVSQRWANPRPGVYRLLRRAPGR